MVFEQTFSFFLIKFLNQSVHFNVNIQKGKSIKITKRKYFNLNLCVCFISFFTSFYPNMAKSDMDTKLGGKRNLFIKYTFVSKMLLLMYTAILGKSCYFFKYYPK